ncbi:hypothetical protein [Butyrivibrio sp. VCB2001]|uniref:hypothetical protein n=1 Tax=Butyrivibrio sp. VCB2001 TaxID=1280667 RepID=UPI0004046EE9|nr:hypothetical protein [Butyrivibrio sp. VCB2001]
MKKKFAVMLACVMALGLVACGTKTEETSSLQVEEIPAAEESVQVDKITEEQATQAIHDYCIESFPDLANMEGSDDYTLYWEASTNENGEIVVLYRAYTGALIRYYVNPETGDTYVTEQVPGIIDDEQRTEETLNVKDYIK